MWDFIFKNTTTPSYSVLNNLVRYLISIVKFLEEFEVAESTHNEETNQQI